MGANPVVETPDDVADPIMPDGMPTPPTPLVDTALLTGSSFTFITVMINGKYILHIGQYSVTLEHKC